jgi:hypothetical protein
VLLAHHPAILAGVCGLRQPERRWSAISYDCTSSLLVFPLVPYDPTNHDLMLHVACRQPEHKLLKDSCDHPQVWLKHDLRLDDHPGFQQASHDASTLVPFFSIAPELYTHLLRTPSGVEGARCSCKQCA